MLEKPIFIKSSFIKPVFDKEKEYEIKDSLKYIQSFPLNKEIQNDLESLLNELIHINSIMLGSFENTKELTNSLYLAVNGKKYMSHHNQETAYAVYRTIADAVSKAVYIEDANWKRYLCIRKLLQDVIFTSRNIENNFYSTS